MRQELGVITLFSKGPYMSLRTILGSEVNGLCRSLMAAREGCSLVLHTTVVYLCTTASRPFQGFIVFFHKSFSVTSQALATEACCPPKKNLLSFCAGLKK